MDHADLARQMRDILLALGKANLGHRDLHLGNFLLSNGRLYLVDGYAVRRGGLRLKDVLLLAHRAGPHASRTDLLRTWKALGLSGDMPRKNGVSRRLRREWLARIFKDDRYFGRLVRATGRGTFSNRPSCRSDGLRQAGCV